MVLSVPPTVYPSADGAAHIYDFYTWAREFAPVHELAHRPNAFAVMRYADVRAVLADPEVFTNDGSLSSFSEFEAMIATPGEHRVMTDVDGPEHKAKRRLAFGPLKPRRLRDYEPEIRAIADRLVDRFLARGRCEFVAEFAAVLAIMITLWLMGLPESEVEWIAHWGGSSRATAWPSCRPCSATPSAPTPRGCPSS